jgi:multiple sugar transport system substrate-binding protein
LKFHLLIPTILLLVILSACKDTDKPDTPQNTPSPVATQAATEEASADPSVSLKMVWFEWQPCQALAELVKEYPNAAVEVSCVPHSEWHDVVFTDFSNQTGADIVILDSQFIGEAVIKDHIVELTDWLPTNVEMNRYVPAALSAYGEYPPNSQRYYGVAFEADTMMLVYRKDLFEAAEFAPPITWNSLLEQAQFFKESDLVPYGYTTFWCNEGCYDTIQTAWNQIAWSFGGQLWDASTYTVDGVLNSPENVAALEFATALYETGPVDSKDYGFAETVNAVCSGEVAMSTIWFGFGPSFLDPATCEQAENLDFAVVPAGPQDHVISLGGMGLHVSAYSEQQTEALALVAWLSNRETQLKWAEMGGFSARTDILSSNKFAEAAPYNPAFSVSYLLVRDFWNLPEYIELLEVQGNYLHLAITNEMDAQAALDAMAEEQQAILDAAYEN